MTESNRVYNTASETQEEATAPSQHFDMDGQQNGSDGSAEPLHQPAERTPTWKEFWCSCRLAELLLCFVPLIIGAFTEAFFYPRQRPIPYQYLDNTGDYIVNQVFNEIFMGETVPTLMLVMVTGWLPFILQYLLIQCCLPRGSTEIQKWDLLHKTLCVYVAALGTTLLITNSIKLYVGYLRPIFYDQCQPNEDYTACTALDSEGNTDERQLRLSFPSGHASFSVCGLLLFSKFLEQRFGMYKDLYQRYNTKQQNVNGEEQFAADTPEAAELGGDYRRTQQQRRIPRAYRLGRFVSLLCYAPMTVALFVAASRVIDNKHHPADVIGGSLLGGSIAHLVFSIWFPSWEQLLMGG